MKKLIPILNKLFHKIENVAKVNYKHKRNSIKMFR